MDSRRDDRDANLHLSQCDSDEDGQWLTYVQLAEKRGVTLRAVMRQAQRQHLRRMKANDGKTLVWVPRDMVMRPDHVSARLDTSKARSDRAGDVAVAVAALERAHERELRAKDALIADLRNSVERAELQASVAAERLQQMERADAARRAATLPARLWRAWRGR